MLFARESPVVATADPDVGAWPVAFVRQKTNVIATRKTVFI